MQTYVLVADSEDDVAKTVHVALKGMVDRVDYAADGATALLMVQDVDYSLIVLDLLLPRLGGGGVCAAMRARGCQAPILAVTAYIESITPLLGLETGIDDYLPKPVDVAELRVRAGALMEDCAKARLRSAPREPVQVGDLCVDPLTREVRVHGRLIGAISDREIEALHFLAQHPGVAYSREELLSAVWGIHCPIDFKLTGLDLQRLRDKIVAAGYEYFASTEETHPRKRKYSVRFPAWLRVGPLIGEKPPTEPYGKP